MVKRSRKSIEKALVDQLEQQAKKTPYTIALVDDYMRHYDLVQSLWKDIEERGVKVPWVNSKGFVTVIDNDSIGTIQKEQVVMLKMLQTLKLQDPVKAASSDDYL